MRITDFCLTGLRETVVPLSLIPVSPQSNYVRQTQGPSGVFDTQVLRLLPTLLAAGLFGAMGVICGNWAGGGGMT